MWYFFLQYLLTSNETLTTDDDNSITQIAIQLTANSTMVNQLFKLKRIAN